MQDYRCSSELDEQQGIFYIDDASPTSPSAVEPQQLQQQQQQPRPSKASLQQRRRKSSVSSQCSGSLGASGAAGRPRRHRRPSEFIEQQQQHGSAGRRSSHCQQRPRANSCVRPTPLGDARRASVCRPKTGRRQSIAAQQRRDSNRLECGRSTSSAPPTPTSLEALGLADGKEIVEPERARRHRRIAMVLLGTFLFILVASVLAVVVTLTHSSFHTPATGSKELAEHRANSARKTRSC